MANIITKLLPLPGFRMISATHLNEWATAINSAFNGATAALAVTVTSTLTGLSATATTAGGATAPALAMGTAALGVYFGSSAPTIAAPKGSLYLRSDGSSTSTRLYVNTDGSTTWTNVTTAA